MEIREFREISPLELGNAMKLIGKDWMLITALDEKNGRVNAMTASWGCMGVLWNKNICVCFIRPQRHTYGLVEQNERLSLAFLGEEYREALKLCGAPSSAPIRFILNGRAKTGSLRSCPSRPSRQDIPLCTGRSAHQMKL